jgi:hypothetical protein
VLGWWDEIIGIKQPRLPETRAAARELVQIGATQSQIAEVRTRLLSIKDHFWKARGVHLKHIVSNWHLAVNAVADHQASQPKTNTLVIAGPRRKLARKA